MLKILARTNRQEKDIRGIQTGKEEIKLSLYADNMIPYLKDPKDSTKRHLDLFSKVARDKIDLKINSFSVHQ